MVDPKTFEKESMEIEKHFVESLEYKYPITGLFFKSKNPNHWKISNDDALRMDNIWDGLAMSAYIQNLHSLNITEGMFPINS